MSYTTINKSSSFMNTKLWTGDGSTQTISGVGFQPDWTWVKGRNAGGESHRLTDIIRGVGYNLKSSSSGAQFSVSNGIQSWNSDGFIIGPDDAFNKNTKNFVSWNWKAGNSQGSSNTDGSINTTYTSVNTTAGFSISNYTGTGANATVGHGLGAVPKWIIVKKYDGSDNWTVYHASLGATKEMRLDTTDSVGTSSARWNDTEPTSSLFYLGNDNSVNASGGTYVAYCFAEKTGYSKFGQYTGNGSSNGSFIFTGFKPSLVITKCFAGTNAGSTNWSMMDNKRFGYNTILPYLYANTNSAEETTQNVNNIDILSNGFKCKESDSNRNAGGNSYIFMAFGQSLVGTNNIPNNAF